MDDLQSLADGLAREMLRSSYYQKDISELLKGVEENDLLAISELARRYERANDLKEAYKYYSLASRLGDATASFYAGRVADKLGNYRDAAKFFELSIERLDDPEAHVYLAQYYHTGKMSGFFNFFNGAKKGFQHLLNAAQQGYAKAQYQLALCYLRGSGTYININRYIFWIRCAQANEYEEAIHHIHTRIRTDPRLAKAWHDCIDAIDQELIQHDEYFAFERTMRCAEKGLREENK